MNVFEFRIKIIRLVTYCKRLDDRASVTNGLADYHRLTKVF